MGKWFYIGVGMGLLFWFFSAFLHSFIFENETSFSLFRELFSDDLHKLFVRGFVLILFLAFGLYAQFMSAKQEKTIHELEEALSEIKILRGILPICSHCKKVRDDEGYWNQIEAYIQKHSEAKFSHSICKECMKKYYPDLNTNEE